MQVNLLSLRKVVTSVCLFLSSDDNWIGYFNDVSTCEGALAHIIMITYFSQHRIYFIGFKTHNQNGKKTLFDFITKNFGTCKPFKSGQFILILKKRIGWAKLCQDNCFEIFILSVLSSKRILNSKSMWCPKPSPETREGIVPGQIKHCRRREGLWPLARFEGHASRQQDIGETAKRLLLQRRELNKRST